MLTKLRDRSTATGLYVLLAAMSVLVLVPFLWTALTSIKPDRDLLSIPPTLLPKSTTLIHYRQTLQDADFVAYFQNSLIVSITSTVLAMVIGAPAAYGFARFPFRMRGVLFGAVVATRMFPPVTLMIPFFLFMRSAGLIDTRPALIITYLTIELPLVIWILEGFFRELPTEVTEAGRIDGLGHFGVFRRIALPLSLPALSVAAALAFINAWNEFLFSLALTRTPASQTVPVGLAGAITSEGFKFGPMTAGATLYILPVLIFTVLAQRGLIKGLATGGSTG
jgi:ABC-type glycerol-3-phosphate transport system permease component